MPRQPEAKLVKKIQDLIRAENQLALKIHGGDNPFQRVGIPDVLACLWGVFVGIEVKQPGEPISVAQRLVLREIYDADGIAAVVETAGQAALLLSTIKDWRKSEVPYRSRCFDRGSFKRRFDV